MEVHGRKAIISLELMGDDLVFRIRPSGCRTGWYMSVGDYIARCNMQDRDSTGWIKDKITVEQFKSNKEVES